MTNRETFIAEVTRRMQRMFAASKQGYRTAAVERHRLEGFMNAGIFMGLCTNSELAQRMEAIHFEVFGKTIADRKSGASLSWIYEEATDYSAYESPTFERVKEK